MKIRKYILPAIISAILFIWLINVALAPLYTMKELQAMVESDTLFLEKYGRIRGQLEIDSLLAEQAYRQALLELAAKDSIHLVVNLSDSTVNLYIKGVRIHRTKATCIERSKLFERMSALQVAKVFSSPLPVRSQYATIVKEPVVIRHAPKDTLEAALNAWEPDTLIQNPAFLALDLEHGFQVLFEQDLNSGFRDRREKFAFYSRLRLEKTAESLYRLIRLKKQEYHAVVTIKLDKDDLRAIYRALPENAYLVFKDRPDDRKIEKRVIRSHGLSLSMPKHGPASNKENQVLSDAEIILKIRESGSGEDFGILYERYHSKVLDKCYGMIRNRGEALELTEDIFIRAFEKLPGFRQQSTFSSWLYSITYNHCVDYLRERKKLHYPKWNAKNELPDLSEEPEEFEEDLDYDKLMEILEMIHPEEKALILMKYQDNLSIKQIGQALRLSEAALKMRLKRARTRIIYLYNSKFR